MNNGVQSSSAHSAEVRMQLCVNGHVLPIAQMGPNFLLVNHTIHHPPTTAEIFLAIDGDESRWIVHLPEGLQPNCRRVSIASCNGVLSQPSMPD
jgi:hypothetical protein